MLEKTVNLSNERIQLIIMCGVGLVVDCDNQVGGYLWTMLTVIVLLTTNEQN